MNTERGAGIAKLLSMLLAVFTFIAATACTEKAAEAPALQSPRPARGTTPSADVSTLSKMEAMMVDIPGCKKQITARTQTRISSVINARYTFWDGTTVVVSGVWEDGFADVPLETSISSSIDPTTRLPVKCTFSSIAGVRTVSCLEHDDILRITSWKSGDGVFSAGVYKPTEISGARAEEALRAVTSEVVAATHR